MPSKVIIGVRHLADHNRLRTNLFDGPLVSGQEPKASEIGAAIRNVMRECGSDNVKIVHSPQRRSTETANMVGSVLRCDGALVSVSVEPGLNEIDQGLPIFPPGYVDGDFLPCLPKAWKVFCRESYDRGDLGYKFGSGEMASAFEKAGESMLDVLPRQYEVFGRLFSGDLELENGLAVVCAHSTTLHIIYELHHLAIELEKGRLNEDFPPQDLPRLCWRVFQQEAGRSFPKDLEFGQMLRFDLEVIRKSVLPAKLQAARKLLQRGSLLVSV